MPSTDLSPQEIASEMTVFPTTVRTHARNAYHKLEVHSRFEAVQRAKEFALLLSIETPHLKDHQHFYLI